MTDFLNLDSRTSKLEKEQQKRREQARLRIQREKKTKELAARDRAKVEEQIKARKLEQQKKEEEARKLEEADQIRTGGIRYKESLLPVIADGEGDKVLLPPSALEALSQQDAVGMGPMLFELTCTTPDQAGETTTSVCRTTHAGVLEFVADEGTIGLPRKVVLSLLGAAAQQVPFHSSTDKEQQLARERRDEVHGGTTTNETEEKTSRPPVDGLNSVTVRYVRLAKAKFARVVPETVGLSQVSELRAMLEHNMRNHATLTVGDRLSVWRRGKEFSMKVVELRPEPQVTLIDTDMEIELDLPEEAREKLEEKGAQDRAKTLRAHMGTASSPTTGGQSLSPMPGEGGAKNVSAMDEDSDSDLDSDEDEESLGERLKNAFDPEKHRLAKLQELPEEPPRDEDGVFTCQLRSSQGKSVRRFRFGDALGVLFDFAEAQGGVPGHYRVVVPFPRRVLTRDEAVAGMTLKEAGLTSKQESVILERL